MVRMQVGKFAAMDTTLGAVMADIRQVTDSFAVAPQIGLDEFALAAAQGFKHIINNRPDGEAPGQPTSAQAEAAARAAGLTYAFAPFVGHPTPAAIEAAAAAHGPTLAYCRSGMRSITAWALAQAAGGTSLADILESAYRAGYSLDPLSALLKQSGAR